MSRTFRSVPVVLVLLVLVACCAAAGPTLTERAFPGLLAAIPPWWRLETIGAHVYREHGRNLLLRFFDKLAHSRKVFQLFDHQDLMRSIQTEMMAQKNAASLAADGADRPRVSDVLSKLLAADPTHEEYSVLRSRAPFLEQPSKKGFVINDLFAADTLLPSKQMYPRAKRNAPEQMVTVEGAAVDSLSARELAGVLSYGIPMAFVDLPAPADESELPIGWFNETLKAPFGEEALWGSDFSTLAARGPDGSVTACRVEAFIDPWADNVAHVLFFPYARAEPDSEQWRVMRQGGHQSSFSLDAAATKPAAARKTCNPPEVRHFRGWRLMYDAYGDTQSTDIILTAANSGKHVHISRELLTLLAINTVEKPADVCKLGCTDVLAQHWLADLRHNYKQLLKLPLPPSSNDDCE